MSAKSEFEATALCLGRTVIPGLRFLMLVASILLLESALLAQDTIDLARTIEQAKTPDEAAVAVNSLLRLYARGEQLSTSKIPSVAVYDAWRKHAKIIPWTETRFGAQLPEDLERRSIQRFFGIVEGRLQIDIPDWWETLLQTPRVHQPFQTKSQPLLWQSRTTSTEGTSIANQNGRDVVLPPAEFYWLSDGSDELEFRVTTTEHVVLVMSRPSEWAGGRIICISTMDMKTLWRREIWGANDPLIGSSGPEAVRVDCTSIQTDGGTVSVFGSKCYKIDVRPGPMFLRPVFYLEQFSLADGKVLCRFATNLWNSRVDEALIRKW